MAAFKQIIVDGYNVGHKLGIKVTGSNLEFIRSKVEALVLKYCISLKIKATIVYDGMGVLASSERNSNLDIEFTPDGKTADSRIKELVDRFYPKKSVLVISSDHSIQQYAKLSGFKTIHSEIFIQESTSGRSSNKPINKTFTQKEKPTNVSDSEVQKWLKLFNS